MTHHAGRRPHSGRTVAAAHRPGERSREDPWTSHAFAVADHQVAHVYVSDPADVPAVAEVLDEGGKKAHGLDHPRTGQLVLLAEPEEWFRAGAALLREKLGLRYLMNVVGLDQGARAVRGSHGLLPRTPPTRRYCSALPRPPAAVKDLLLRLTPR